MAKAYVPAGDTSQVKDIVEPITQIPPYDEIGTVYRGYSKQVISGNRYKLRVQTPKVYYDSDARIAPATYDSITRTTSSTTNFYCTDITIVPIVPASFPPTTYLAINNQSTGSNYVVRFWLQPGTITLHLAAPIKFEGDIYFAAFGNLANEGVSFALSGWEEEK